LAVEAYQIEGEEAMSEQQEFEFEPLNQNERAVLHTLFCHLAVENQETFTSDTIRDLGLDLTLYGEDSKKLGSLLARAVHFKWIEDTGARIPSHIATNHGREIKVYHRVRETRGG
jgi:hypothetical protein